MSHISNLQRLHHYLQDLESPNHFIDWSFYFLISSCLARRIWIGNGFETYANTFVIFVGKPSCGKSLPATEVSKILKDLVDVKTTEDGKIIEIPLIHTSPDSVTLEGLWQALGDATDFIKICDNPKRFYAHSSVAFCLGEEMGTLFRDKTEDLVTFLTQAWDCRNFYRKTKSCGEVKINNMCVNLLGCCTPDWVKRNMQRSVLHEGFTSRTIMLWGDKPRKRSTLLRTDAAQIKSLEELKKHLKIIAKLPPGELKLNPIDTPYAYEWFDNWVQTKMDKSHINNNPKLDHYYGRKKRHLMKLAMIMHFADKTTMQLDVEDFEKALLALEAVEIDMDKAIVGAMDNPMASVSDSIMAAVEEEGQISEKRILLDFYHRADQEQITKILQYLVYVGRLTTASVDGKTMYSVPKN